MYGEELTLFNRNMTAGAHCVRCRTACPCPSQMNWSIVCPCQINCVRRLDVVLPRVLIATLANQTFHFSTSSTCNQQWVWVAPVVEFFWRKCYSNINLSALGQLKTFAVVTTAWLVNWTFFPHSALSGFAGLKQYAFAETIICGLKCNFPLSLCQRLLTMLIAQLLMTWRPNENECLTVLIHRVREKLSVKSASPHSVPRCSTIFPSCGYKSTFYHISPCHPLLYFPLRDGNMVERCILNTVVTKP